MEESGGDDGLTQVLTMICPMLPLIPEDELRRNLIRLRAALDDVLDP